MLGFFSVGLVSFGGAFSVASISKKVYERLPVLS